MVSSSSSSSISPRTEDCKVISRRKGFGKVMDGLVDSSLHALGTEKTHVKSTE